MLCTIGCDVAAHRRAICGGHSVILGVSPMSLLANFQVEKQKVDDAINIVCDRLEHATLLQDRRAAVLSLKGFAREYKEAVTAGGLRGLLKSLKIDKEDNETLNATLECLLLLFTVDEGGLVDDTALWIADEFTLVCF